MTIKVTYNVTDVYVTQDVSPVYINVSYSTGSSGGSAVWGGITGTLSDQTDLQSALDLKVPYTGATANVNLGEYEIKAGQVTLDTSPTGTAAVGTTRWNDTTGLSETTLKGGTVVLKNGVDLVARVVNKVSPNTTLTKAAYQAVRVSGAQGQRLAVAFAQANNDNNSADTIGLVTETIATNQEGFIITVGQLENINTTGSLQGETWADGDVLYLSPTTAGALTNIKPNATIGHIVVIGYVEYAHANNGKIYVKVMNGWELGELHDVYVPTPSNNDVLTYETSSGLWKNKSVGTALGYTPANSATTLTINGVTYDLSANRSWTVSGGISGSGASGQVAYWTGTSAQSGSNNLFWDSANGRLGIGTNAPTNRLTLGTAVAAALQSSSVTLFSSMQDTSNIFALTVSSDTGVEHRGVFAATRSRGTLLAPTAVVAGDSIFTLIGSAYDGSATQATALITFAAESNASAGNAPQTINFITGSSAASRTTKVQLRSNGNILLQNGGTFTDSGERLQVTGNVKVSGSIAQANISDGLTVGAAIAFVSSQPTITATTSLTLATGSAGFTQIGKSAAISNTSGAFGVAVIGTDAGNFRAFAPTSGTATYTILRLAAEISQSGGANGITRGLYINPTLTAAADFRAIETTNGKVIFGNLPTSSAGLPTGAIWNDSGTIKIV